MTYKHLPWSSNICTRALPRSATAMDLPRKETPTERGERFTTELSSGPETVITRACEEQGRAGSAGGHLEPWQATAVGSSILPAECPRDPKVRINCRLKQFSVVLAKACEFASRHEQLSAAKDYLAVIAKHLHSMVATIRNVDSLVLAQRQAFGSVELTTLGTRMPYADTRNTTQ